MKVLVFSDSHGVSSDMARITLKETPDMVFHLGDYASDANRLREQLPEVPLYGVTGNCDIGMSGQDSRMLEQDGVRIFMTHGHAYHVKWGIDSAVNAAKQKNADILLFGHTHRPIYQINGGLHVLNPGSVSGVHTERKTYGVVEISGGRISCCIRSL